MPNDECQIQTITNNDNRRKATHEFGIWHS